MLTINSAEILSVGTELLLGEIIDTNSAYLARELADRGVNVYWSQRVGDNLLRIQAAIEQALLRSDLLLITGGLGPTDDDMTREAIAGLLQEAPFIDPQLEHELREKFSRFARSMPERNLKQAWLIPSATSLANPVGTAPGWLVTTTVAGKLRVIVTLPGPPRELTRMWLEQVVPRLQFGEAALYARTFKTFGLGESAAAELLGELTRQANPSVATYAKRDGVHVRVAAKATTMQQASHLAAAVVGDVDTMLQPHIWGYDEDELVPVIMAGLAKQGQILASLETFTGGMLSETLSSPDNYSQFAGGMVAWNMRALSTPLLELGTTFEGTTFSESTALDMAGVAKKLFRADIGLAIHGELASKDSPMLVFIAAQGTSWQAAQTLRLPALGSAWMRERATYAALFLLWSQLNAVA